MTVEEILEIIDEKHTNALNDLFSSMKKISESKYYHLQGEIHAYWDLICLIKSRLGREEKDGNTSKN